MEIDQDVCPLCGKPNGCEHHSGGPEGDTCWCHMIAISREVREKVTQLLPPHAVSKVCICKPCWLKHGAKELVPKGV